MPPKILIEDNGEYKVRELSGYEGLTLMGVPREDVDRIKASGLTNGQMMKLAGNSIIVDVMSSFFKEMIKC
jgi:DNA (cytosine-5)-methyltransferase 1